MEELDRACRRILEAKYRLGLFSEPYRYCKPQRAETELYTEEHLEAAREIAAETFVLLKNDGNILPLQKKGKIALIGPLADAGNNMCGMWSQLCVDSRHISLLQAFKEGLGNDAELLMPGAAICITVKKRSSTPPDAALSRAEMTTRCSGRLSAWQMKPT